MAYLQYPPTSPYFNTPQLDWRMGRYVHRTIPAAPTDRSFLITPTYHERPDRLAYDLYGSAEYWWVFMARNLNAIRDPIFDLTQGKTIIIPSPDSIANIK